MLVTHEEIDEQRNVEQCIFPRFRPGDSAIIDTFGWIGWHAVVTYYEPDGNCRVNAVSERGTTIDNLMVRPDDLRVPDAMPSDTQRLYYLLRFDYLIK